MCVSNMTGSSLGSAITKAYLPCSVGGPDLDEPKLHVHVECVVCVLAVHPLRQCCLPCANFRSRQCCTVGGCLAWSGGGRRIVRGQIGAGNPRSAVRCGADTWTRPAPPRATPDNHDAVGPVAALRLAPRGLGLSSASLTLCALLELNDSSPRALPRPAPAFSHSPRRGGFRIPPSFPLFNRATSPSASLRHCLSLSRPLSLAISVPHFHRNVP